MRILVVALIALAACNHPWNPGASCGRTGEDCLELADCCSFACSGVCECAGQGVFCKIDAACCTGLVCQNEQCVPGCRAEGATCDTDAECCAGGCEAGFCGTPRCNASGESCQLASECCNGLGCVNGMCTSACAALDAACQTFSNPCCSGLECEPTTQHCVAACTHKYSQCQNTSECCTGLNCGLTTPGECDCTFQDLSCSTDTQCCTGYCRPSDQRCECAPIGHTCETTSQCCSGFECRQGECRPLTCQGSLAACVDGTDCCGAGCDAGSCCTASAHACNTSADYCCDGQFCDVTQCAQCHGPGGACGGGLSSKACCSPSSCRNGSTCCYPPAGPCTMDNDCCTGGRCNGASACCNTDGVLCATGADCCSGNCVLGTSNVKTCVCTALGGGCTDALGCCDSAALCSAGKCCRPSNFSCVVDTDCCSGTCRTNNKLCM